MVKWPLTRLAYPRAWVPASPTAIKPDPFANSLSRTALDTLEPAPTVLLSAEEAKDRLREIVEGFFFRPLKGEDGKHIRRLLVKSPPGLGKTREAVHWAIRYQAEQKGKDFRRVPIADHNEAGISAQTSIFVPRHQLAEELKEVIERAFHERKEPITVPILRGRENGGEEGKAPCRRWREARALAKRALPIYTNLCERRIEGQALQCPYFAGCEYIRARRPNPRRLSSWCIPTSAWSGARRRLSEPAGRPKVLLIKGTTARSARATSTRSRPISSSAMRTRPSVLSRSSG